MNKEERELIIRLLVKENERVFHESISNPLSVKSPEYVILLIKSIAVTLAHLRGIGKPKGEN